MLPFGIGFGEVLLIAVVILLVVGPQKLPEIARTLGKGFRAVRRAGQELRDAVDVEEVKRSVYEPVNDWRAREPVRDVVPDSDGVYAAADAADAAAAVDVADPTAAVPPAPSSPTEGRTAPGSVRDLIRPPVIEPDGDEELDESLSSGGVEAPESDLDVGRDDGPERGSDRGND